MRNAGKNTADWLLKKINLIPASQLNHYMKVVYFTGRQLILSDWVTIWLMIDFKTERPGVMEYTDLKKSLQVAEKADIKIGLNVIEVNGLTFKNLLKEHSELNVPNEQEQTHICDIKKDISVFANHVDNNDLRPNMCRIHFTGSEVVATDAHMLIREEQESKESFYINKVVAKSTKQHDLTVLRGEKYLYLHACICCDGFMWVIHRFDEQFPAYQNVFPTNNNRVSVVNRVDLLENLKKAVICANPFSYPTELIFNEEGMLKVFSEDKDTESSFSGHIRHKTRLLEKPEGSKEEYEKAVYIRIGVNAKSLIQILSQIRDEEVEIRTSTPNRALLINDNYLLMPIMLSNYF